MGLLILLIILRPILVIELSQKHANEISFPKTTLKNACVLLFITRNPRLINERGFKSREGYNGACMVPTNDEHFQNSASIYVTFSVVLN